MNDHENELTWDQADTPGERLALIFSGVQVAAINEIGRLYAESCPVWDWKDGKIVDASKEIDQQITGRGWFLIGLALLGAVPLLGCLLYFVAKPAFEIIMPFFGLIFAVMSLGTFSLGAWYGDKPTRRNCLILTGLILPVMIGLIYWWATGGYEFE